MNPKWISYAKQKPNKDDLYCWVMNTRKGAYGFIAVWHQRGEYFEYDRGHSHLNPALDVTHWYPLPIPAYNLEEDS